MAQLYYDNFADEVVTEIDEIAPPERYIRVHCGSDVFIEKWAVDSGSGNYTCLYHYLEVAYTSADRENGLVAGIRHDMEDKYKVHLTYMTDWTVTPEHYKKMEKAVRYE